MSNDCGVCMEECKENLTCGACNTTYCIKCSQTYLLSVSEAHCMGCKKIWDERFLRDHFPKAWMNKNYKNKIKNVLFEKELSYIPASMTLAGRVNTHKRDLAKYYEYMANDHRFDEQINKLKKELALLGLGNAIENKEKIKEITTEIKNLTTKKTKIPKVSLPNKISLDPNAVERFRRDGTRYYTTVHITEEEKQIKNTSVKCSTDSCLGYLDSNSHCNACNKDICKKCNQEKVKEHKCKKEDIETVEYLQKNTKGCPKCGIRTSKVDGCDQMWCVDCKTAWNWSTGDIVTGHIHNPEYFRYMRERGLQIPQNPNQHHNYNNRNYGCVDREIFDMRFNLLFRERGVRNVGLENFNIGKYTVAHLHTFCDNLFRHLDNFRLQNGRKNETRGIGLQELGIYYREVHEFDTYKVKRISYIMKNITEEEFKSSIIKGHREMEYKNMIYLLCETLTMVIEDTLRKIQEYLVKTVMPENRTLSGEYFSKEVFDELLNYMDYFNNESKKISELFGYRKHFQVTIDKEKSKVIVKQPKCIKVKKDSEEEESEEESEEEKSEEERYIPKSKKKD